MQQIAVPRVVHGVEEPDKAEAVAAGAGDEVGDPRRGREGVVEAGGRGEIWGMERGSFGKEEEG